MLADNMSQLMSEHNSDSLYILTNEKLKKQQAYQYGDQYAQYGMHPDDHVTSCGGPKLSGGFQNL